MALTRSQLPISGIDGGPTVAGVDVAGDGWQARVGIELAVRAGRTVITGLGHRGPLRVQRPFYPQADGTCHLYLVHPPGGLVGGDRLTIDVDVDAGARALITTPAAGKFYRSEQRLAEQSQRCRVGAGAALDWLPQETIYFSGSWSRMTTHVELASDASFVGWDLTVLGRPAAGERFTAGDCRQSFGLHRDGQPLWLERGHYRGGSPLLDDDWGLGGHTASGVLVAAGPVLSAGASGPLVDAARASLEQHAPGGRHAVTAPGPLLLCRMLAGNGEDIRRAFTPVWRALRLALVGSPAAIPRVWAT